MNRRTFAALVVLPIIVIAAAIAGRAYIDAYPERYPQAWEFLHDWQGEWNAPFTAKTVGADGLRIRAPHADGQLLFETHDADLAREFLDLVQIDEPASGRHCMCSRGNVIEVLHTTALRPWSDVAFSFSVQHGSALRSGDLWPSDAQLTGDSAEAVCAWLVAHGVNEESPAKQVARIAAEVTARDAAQDALLGSERAQALRECPDAASVAELLEEWAPDITDRIVLAVRFIAIGSPTDDDVGGRARERVRTWLWKVDDFAAVAAAFDRLLAADADAFDVAYEFEPINRWHGDEFPADVLPGLRERVARTLLASANDYHRVCGVEMLGQVDSTPEIRATLLGLLPPSDNAGAPTEPTTDSQMEAASLVVAFCDPSMFPRLQALADAAEDRRRWARHMSECIAARRDPADVELERETMHVLPRAPLEGVVRASDGTVVADASVRLTDPRRTPTVGEFFAYTIRTDTDEHGRFHLDVPIGRSWHLSVVHVGHPYLLRRHVDLRDPPAQPMELVLPKERTIRGRVVDAKGLPIGGARVFAARQSPFTTHSHESGATAAEDGTFELRGFDAEVPAVRVSIHLHGRSGGDDSATSESHEFVLRPDDPPVELRILESGDW